MEQGIIIIKGLEPLGLALGSLLHNANIKTNIFVDDLNIPDCPKTLLPCLNKFDIQSHADVEQLTFPRNDIKYLFIVVGVFLEKILTEVEDEEINILYNLHFLNPVRLLRKFYYNHKSPCHLVIVGSCSSWRIQNNQTIYTAIRSAQSTFARNLAPELAKEIPGSKISLINLGGIKTPELNGKIFGKDHEFMSPTIVAEMILDNIRQQTSVFAESQIMRKKPVISGSMPIFQEGPCIPEVYSE